VRSSGAQSEEICHYEGKLLRQTPQFERGSNMTIEANGKALFRLGRMFITPGAQEAVMESGQTAFEFLRRHQTGDWGEVSAEDREENELSLKEGFRLLSAYRTTDGTKIWVITEADRSATTLLLPSEY
jgi:hypothetical protein